MENIVFFQNELVCVGIASGQEFGVKYSAEHQEQVQGICCQDVQVLRHVKSRKSRSNACRRQCRRW